MLAAIETAAILAYLDERHPGVLGPRPESGARAAYLSWFFFVTNTIHPLTMLLVHPERAAGEALDHFGTTSVEDDTRRGVRGN